MLVFVNTGKSYEERNSIAVTMLDSLHLDPMLVLYPLLDRKGGPHQLCLPKSPLTRTQSTSSAWQQQRWPHGDPQSRWWHYFLGSFNHPTGEILLCGLLNSLEYKREPLVTWYNKLWWIQRLSYPHAENTLSLGFIIGQYFQLPIWDIKEQF
jgi:hypothetical protein